MLEVLLATFDAHDGRLRAELWLVPVAADAHDALREWRLRWQLAQHIFIDASFLHHCRCLPWLMLMMRDLGGACHGDCRR